MFIFRVLVATAGFLAFLDLSVAKTVTGGPGKTADEASVIGVAGPAPRKPSPAPSEVAKPSPQPNKKVLKKVKITPPPPMHDPN